MEQVLAGQLHVAQAAAAPLPVAVAVPQARCCRCCACCAGCGGLIGVQLPSTNSTVPNGNSHAPAGAQRQRDAVGGHLVVGWESLEQSG